MRKVALLFLTVIIIVSVAAVGRSQTYDVVIKSGRIYDGSGGPSYVADVGIKDGYIAAIGQLQPAVARLAEPSRDRPDYAGTSFTNVIYTKLSTFPSREISGLCIGRLF